MFHRGWIRDLCAALGISLLAFGLINALIGAVFLKEPTAAQPDLFSVVSQPGSPMGLDYYRRLFSLGPSEDPMARFKASPKIVQHPVLPFATETLKNQFFHIGLEGIRYEPGWDDLSVQSLLAGTRPLVFAFGGSTTLGHGLAGDETWPFMLNQILRAEGSDNGQAPIVVNFGAQAYDQKLEIDRLIYLLRKGYRPRQVLFLDGWNDLFLARSNMQLWDKVVYHGFSVGRGKIAYTPGTLMNRPATLQLALRAIPFVRLIDQYSSPPLAIPKVKHNRVAYMDGFDFHEAEFVFRNWAAYGELHRAEFIEQITAWYRSNLQLLRALAHGYGFQLTVLYQPIGALDPRNTFVPTHAHSAPGYQYIRALVAAVRAQISQGHLEMIDLTASLERVDGPRYIDVVHYAPAANRAIAEAISPSIRRQ
jgi:hypothetical protein